MPENGKTPEMKIMDLQEIINEKIAKNLQDEIDAAIAKIPCDHKCHKTGLNAWVEYCSICLCMNPNYDEDAQPQFFTPKGADVI